MQLSSSSVSSAQRNSGSFVLPKGIHLDATPDEGCKSEQELHEKIRPGLLRHMLDNGLDALSYTVFMRYTFPFGIPSAVKKSDIWAQMQTFPY